MADGNAIKRGAGYILLTMKDDLNTKLGAVQQKLKTFGRAFSVVGKAAAGLGGSLSALAIYAAHTSKTSGNINKIGEAFSGLKSTIGQLVDNVYAPSVPVFQAMTRSLGQFLTQNQWLVKWAVMGAAGLTGMGVAMIFVGKASKIAAAGITLIKPLISLGFTALANPWVLLGLGIAGVGVAALALTGTLGPLLNWLGTGFTAVAHTATSAFQGIKDAMMAGDWRTAAAILWTGMQLAWHEGTQPLQEIWFNFKQESLATAINLFYGIESAWARVWAGLKASWMLAKSTFFQIWDAMQGKLAQFIDKALEATGYYTPEQAKYLKNMREADSRQQSTDRSRSAADDAAKIIEEQKSELAKIEQARISLLAGTAGMADEESKRLTQKIADLRGQLAGQTARAAAEAAAIPALVASEAAKVSSSGTFTGAAAAGLAGKSAADETAKNTKDSADTLKEIAKNTKNGPGSIVWAG